ncbi:MAG: metallophosphoesterase [Armatimonadota bacterium]
MNRREFLGGSAATLASLAMPNVTFPSSKPKVKVARLGEDHFEIIFNEDRPMRIMQLTDTHFGIPEPGRELTDNLTFKMIKSLVDQNQPDFIFHTGDYINNDKVNPRRKPALDLMNGLGTPWSLVFGNHDHSDGDPGSVTLDQYYGDLQNHAMGYHTGADGKRSYCFRIDLKHGKKPFATVFGFNCGGGEIPKVISAPQVAWFQAQLEADKKKKISHPILVMQHIPTLEYKLMHDAKEEVGRYGEAVCSEVDKGEIFSIYRDSGRVQGVFCGHDHVNDYVGVHQGVRLAYGRVTGWSGYGDWQRGCRMIEVNPKTQTSKTRVVLPAGVTEKPEWQITLKDDQ